MILVKHKREVVLRVILRAQVLLFIWTVGASSDARVQDPTNQIIVVVLLPHSRKVRREIAADQIRAFANRMAGLAAARFKQFLAVRGVSRSLFHQRRPGDGGLPEVSRDRLNLVVLQRNCGILVVGRNSCVCFSQYGIHSL